MSKTRISHLPLNPSKSLSLQQLINYRIRSDSDIDSESGDESLDETIADNEENSVSQCRTEIYANTSQTSGNPVTHIETIPHSNPPTPIAKTTLAPHPLSISASATKPARFTQHNGLQPNNSVLDVYTPHPGLVRENTAPPNLQQTSWPPLMLRPIVVNNNKPYYVMGELGRGATSVVHRVVDMDWKFYALKSVNLEDADQLTLDCYQNEITTLQNLRDHSHVIHMFSYEYCHANKNLLVVMECGQLDLAKIIKENNNQPFELYTIQTYWYDMLKGVTAIHSMDIVHTDLKPNNFVLVNTKLKLIDFGIAYSLNNDATSFEREGRWGTPNYMAPEMIMSIPKSNSIPSQPEVCKISQAADIWSLGCILYKLTYGITPFQHITDKIQKWHAITDPKQPITFQDDISNSLLQVLVSCLSRNAKKRPTGLQLLSHTFLTC